MTTSSTPITRIPMFKVLMAPEASDEVAKVLASGYIGQGPKVEAFEQALTKVLDAEVLTVNSGTSALDLCLHLAGVVTGDEVITTPQTCTATTSAIVNRGAIPVWADIDPTTGLISPKSVEALLTKKTKAIMAVDWGGAPCDYQALNAFGLPVIQDAAHAFGTTVGGESIAVKGGTHVAWSLQAIKHLTTGDGGLVCPPIHQLERGRKLRWFGLDRRSSADFRCSQQIPESGFKYHMNDIAATIGLCNLPKALTALYLHRLNAAFYHEAFKDLDPRRVERPPSNPESAWWLYTILVDDRDGFEAFMKGKSIDVSRVHARNDTHPAFAMGQHRVPLQGVGLFSARHISIPVGWWLSKEDRERVAEAVIAWSKK